MEEQGLLQARHLWVNGLRQPAGWDLVAETALLRRLVHAGAHGSELEPHADVVYKERYFIIALTAGCPARCELAEIGDALPERLAALRPPARSLLRRRGGRARSKYE